MPGPDDRYTRDTIYDPPELPPRTKPPLQPGLFRLRPGGPVVDMNGFVVRPPAKPAPTKAPLPPAPGGALLLPAEVAARLRISPKALEHMRRRGTGPRYIRLAERGVRYSARAVMEWIEAISRTADKR